VRHLRYSEANGNLTSCLFLSLFFSRVPQKEKKKWEKKKKKKGKKKKKKKRGGFFSSPPQPHLTWESRRTASSPAIPTNNLLSSPPPPGPKVMHDPPWPSLSIFPLFPPHLLVQLSICRSSARKTLFSLVQYIGMYVVTPPPCTQTVSFTGILSKPVSSFPRESKDSNWNSN